MARTSRKTKKTTAQKDTYLDRVSTEVQSNQSRLSMILGGLIILVAVILLFNYFNRSDDSSVGPSQQTEQEQTGDVSPENLPGKYTVKEGDTLFLIAEKYYGDGFQYEEIVKANNLASADVVEVGQVLEIPKVEGAMAPAASPAESAMPEVTAEPTSTPQLAPTSQAPADSKGASDTTMQQNWGSAITADTYTVVEGDWLSTIAARAYGDPFAYERIAQANNLTNPNYITPGLVLKLPR